MRGATNINTVYALYNRFQLTRPMRGATHASISTLSVLRISTHTPHAGRDSDGVRVHVPISHFNSHAPCGARLHGGNPNRPCRNFNSHAPCGARRARFMKFVLRKNFNSHAPCGARPLSNDDLIAEPDFNSHAPCGARRRAETSTRTTRGFQLTRPMRGATFLLPFALMRLLNFNSHAPCGARRTTSMLVFVIVEFQLTRPMRGATPWSCPACPAP